MIFYDEVAKFDANYAIDTLSHLLSQSDEFNLDKKAITYDEVKTMYHYMTVRRGVEYGHKGLSNADPEAYFTYEELCVYHGLLVPAHRIWHHALDRMPAHEVTYIVSLLRRKEKLNQEPRINLSTIHGAKGGEADNVALLSDLPRKADEAYYKDPDNERRVFYVGITRAKKKALISFSMNRFYQGDWIDSMASRFIDELPEKNLEKNSFFEEEVNEVEDFEFNQDFEIEEGTRSPGWIRYQKSCLLYTSDAADE